MNDNIISWNPTNWITVILMALVGFGIIAVSEALVLKYRNRTASQQ